MRALFGIVIAIPVAAAFCIAYLIMLGLEAWREPPRAAREEWRPPFQREPPAGLIREAA